MSEPFLGTVMIWAPNFAPRGWAFCQGQILSTTTNAALFSVIGNTYGGDGITDFALPNLAGRLPMGQGQSAGTSAYVLGESAGAELVTLTQANLAQHDHPSTFTPDAGSAASVAVAAVNGSLDSPAGNVPAIGFDANNGFIVSNYAPPAAATGTLGGVTGGAGGTVQIGLAGSAVPFRIVPPYQVLNYVIALEGVFPSQN